MLKKISFSVIYKNSESGEWAEIRILLQENGLELDDDVSVFIIGRKTNGFIVACAGLANQIIKCVAIKKEYQGESISLELGSKVLAFSAQQGIFQLFLYTHPKNKNIFIQWGFYPIIEVSNVVVFMENSKIAISKYCSELTKLKQVGKKIGSIVMNANPFTLGHRALVEYAANTCDWVHIFVVKENASIFSYCERYLLIKEGLDDIPNITIHSGSSYIISNATFPGYFFEDKALINRGWAKTDLLLFRQYIGPALEITHRFVGTEPLDATTNYYNNEMKECLEDDSLFSPKIKVIEIPRLCIDGQPISATKVRKLILEKQFLKIASIVPPTTFKFILNKFKSDI